MGIHVCQKKDNSALTKEWNRLAAERRRQIESGEDLSFEHIIAPTAFKLLAVADTFKVLDIGCGTGEFTRRLAEMSDEVVAVELSQTSLGIATGVCRESENISFVNKPFEGINDLGPPATAAVAVMTLMTASNLEGLAVSASRLMVSGGFLVALFTHPCFWPRYWGYEKYPWFNYEDEIFIEAPFSISNRKTDLITTHIHRPLEAYIQIFRDAGFLVDRICEPLPEPRIENLYPAKWQFPRFIGIRWQKL